MMKDFLLRFSGSKAETGAPLSPPQPLSTAATSSPGVRTVARVVSKDTGTRAPADAARDGNRTASTGVGSARSPVRRPAPADEEAAVPMVFGGGDPNGGRSPPPSARRFGDSSQGSNRPLPPEVQAVEMPVAQQQVVAVATDAPPVPARRRNTATSEQVETFLAFHGDVLTSANGALKTTDRQRLVAAFMADGTLLVHKENPIGPESMEVREAIRRSGRQIRNEFLVELDVIRKMHETAERRSSNGGRSTRGRGGEALQQMQHEVLDLVGEAAARRCSDIHITVGRYEALIRMRCDGVMETVRQVAAPWAADLCAAAFNMADASDAAYRNLEYQGARISEIRTPLPEGVQSIRLQFNPLPNGGRYLIARLLYANSAAESGGDVDTLGYTSVHIDQIQAMRRKPFGINIISGPTGSGKSTTLQRALTALMREKRNQVNVITIEDPPEYVIAGAAQLPVTNASTDEERNEKFRAAIAASLRSDPDIIMIGEIRDRASSGLAFAAAMTGHQVWASLHANDAISILDRFRDQHVEPYKLGDHTLVTGLIGQRLIRRVCPRCSLSYAEGKKKGLVEPHVAREVERLACERLPDIRIANPEPPVHCGCRAGYAGREVLAETINPNLDFMRFIRNGNKEGAVDYWISELDGMTMLEHAGQKMVRGLCDPRDVADKAGNLADIKDSRFPQVFGTLFTGALA